MRLATLWSIAFLIEMCVNKCVRVHVLYITVCCVYQEIHDLNKRMGEVKTLETKNAQLQAKIQVQSWQRGL